MSNMNLIDYFPPTWPELEGTHAVVNGRVNVAALKRLFSTMAEEHPLAKVSTIEAYSTNYNREEYTNLFLKQTEMTIDNLKNELIKYLNNCGGKRFSKEEDFKQDVFRYLRDQKFDVKKEVDIQPKNTKVTRKDLRCDIIVHIKEGFVPIELKYDNTRKLCVKDIEETEWYVQSYDDIPIGLCIFLFSKNCKSRFGEQDIAEMAYKTENVTFPLSKPYYFKWEKTSNMDNTKQGEKSYYYTIIEVEENITLKKYPQTESFLRLWYNKKYD